MRYRIGTTRVPSSVGGIRPTESNRCRVDRLFRNFRQFGTSFDGTLFGNHVNYMENTPARARIKIFFILFAIYLPIQFATAFLLGREPWPLIIQPGFGWISSPDSTTVGETRISVAFLDGTTADVDAGELLGMEIMGPKKTRRMVSTHFRPGRFQEEEWTPWLRRRLDRLYPDQNAARLIVTRTLTRHYIDPSMDGVDLPAPEALAIDL